MRMSIIKRAAALGAAALVGATALVSAPAAQAADGNTSLASVLKAGQAKFDMDYKDYDVLTKAVEAVLAAKPDSAVKVLADGNTALTAFIPNDQAFLNLASALSGKKVTTEAAAFAAVAGLGIDTVESVLLYHVVPGATILSGDALKANGAKLKTALDGKVIRVKVTGKPAIILGDYAPKLPNPRVILTQVDINKGNKQVAHGINAVLLPIAAG
ncbi:MAG: fasciclin domain-containing protein [Actinobacteria bacterium]|nr:fasciclin domain-containing protein [Actinomycetota bacterium]